VGQNAHANADAKTAKNAIAEKIALATADAENNKKLRLISGVFIYLSGCWDLNPN
jgi:hypothetical protein